MGLCFSRKKSPSPPPDPVQQCIPNEEKVEKKKEKQRVVAAQPAAKVAAETKPVFVVARTCKKNTAAEEKGKKKGETPTKKSQQKEDSSNGSGGDRSPLAVDVPPAPVRTSSCTKEEVDAILIHCGRLSRSSSGKTSNENGGGHREYSGSKRSYDFDSEKKGDEEEEWEKPISRPSPHRRTPGRERSGIRERSSGGGRRVSRSPGRRSEGPTSSGSASDRSRQPARMVSVPAREKGGGFAEAGGVGTKMVSSAVATKRGGERRSASPRSRSPANTTRTGNEKNTLHHNPQPQSLSRSSSRKGEKSPCGRNPMAEIDENSLRGNQNGGKAQKTREGEEGVRKLSPSQTQKASENIAQLRKSGQRDGGSNNVISNSVREQLISFRSRAKDRQLEPAMVAEGAVLVEGAPANGEAPLTSIGVESPNPRTRTRSRSLKRSSRDFDHAPGPNPDNHLDPTSRTALGLEDIHNYHQQSTTAFSLPACVSKACSILEAVADLNSSCSQNRNSEADRSRSDNGPLHGRRFGRRGLVPKGPFIESEIIAKDDLMEPSLHRYVSVRDLGGEMEPQESAGSNSFIGQPWSSPWEPHSIDSTDRDWTSHSNNGEEVERQQQESMPLDYSEARRRRLRGGSSTNSLPTTMSSGRKKREFDHHHRRHRGRSASGGGSAKAGGGSAKAGGARSSSLPVAAASS